MKSYVVGGAVRDALLGLPVQDTAGRVRNLVAGGPSSARNPYAMAFLTFCQAACCGWLESVPSGLVLR